ncbi:MAG: sigma-54-dependent transcriptional regulator [Verrucomicrobiota bacterium]
MNFLIVDDEQNVLATTAMTVDTAGHQAFTARNIRQADRILEEEDIHAILLDRMLGKDDGIEYMESLFKRGVRVPVIIFTAHSSIESAVESMRKGAFNYIQKPFVPEQIRHTLRILEEKIDSSKQIEALQTEASRQNPASILESNEPRVNEAFRTAFKAANSEAGILLMGDSGTGKSILARHIHQSSPRKTRPFVEISCPSLSRELLESELFGHVKGAFTGAVKDTWGKVHAAEGGTLFLDEIGELPPEIQPKLLRLLQEWEYERIGETRARKADIRIIAATNRDLETEVREGRFREDLFYRLTVISITMPPLVERPADLEPLAEHFLEFFSNNLNRPQLKFTPEAMAAIKSYGWPGNLREMRNVIERAAILSDGDVIEPGDLSIDSGKHPTRILPGQQVSLREIEEAHIRNVVESSANFEQAAKILQIDTATLYRKRKKMNLN